MTAIERERECVCVGLCVYARERVCVREIVCAGVARDGTPARGNARGDAFGHEPRSRQRVLNSGLSTREA